MQLALEKLAFIQIAGLEHQLPVNQVVLALRELVRIAHFIDHGVELPI